MSVRPTPPDRSNVQGVVFTGYGKFSATHMIMRLDHGAGSINAFVKDLLPLVQSAEHWGDNRPRKLVNLGFTFSGLQATGIPMIRWDMFPIEYRIGPTSYYAQQNLFDLGPSAPGNWTFGNDAEEKRVDVVVHTYGADDAALEEMIQAVTASAATHGLREIIPVTNPPGRFVKSNLPLGFIHFGYRDGMDQPELSWPDPWPGADPDQDFTEPAALNNFVVGYPNSMIMPGPTLFSDPDDATAAFAKDGCYNAFRVFYQDVDAFENFLSVNAPAVAARLAKPEDYAREWIAAKLNGRWRNGSPMELSPDGPDPDTAPSTDFNYHNDARGLRCPFSAHTRLTNPRDQTLFRTAEPLPRILRRGMPYGPVEGEGERGLVGMFLCGSLGEQFEKLNNWINANNFSPVFTQSAQDPLVANRHVPLARHTFTIPMQTGDPVVLDLSGFEFVVTRGTAYCFLPSISSLRAIAETKT